MNIFLKYYKNYFNKLFAISFLNYKIVNQLKQNY